MKKYFNKDGIENCSYTAAAIEMTMQRPINQLQCCQKKKYDGTTFAESCPFCHPFSSSCTWSSYSLNLGSDYGNILKIVSQKRVQLILKLIDV